MSTVIRFRSWACKVPLDHPIRFRWNTITHRDCTVVELTTDDGLTGAAIGLSRGAPIDVVAFDMLAPLVVGAEAFDVAGFQESARAAHSFLDQTGMLAQARSLVDLALWDIRGKALGAPLWRLLGGRWRKAPVLLVEGYELPDESDEQFARRLAARAEEGFTAIKLEAAGYEDPAQLENRLRLTRRLAGEGLALIVDVNGAWRSVREAATVIRRIQDVGLAWVEDPFPHDRIAETGELRGLVDAPLGAGDDVTDPLVLADLANTRAVDVMRVDATTLGGIQATADAVAAARLHGLPVSGHAHAATHQHLSYAWPEAHYVEAFPDDRPFEPSYKLTTSSVYARVQDGHLAPPEEPGLSFELALDRVDAWSVRRAEAIA